MGLPDKNRLKFYHNKNLIESFKVASQGIRHCVRTEINFKIHLSIMCVMMLVAFILQVNLNEWAILMLTSGMVLVLELMNTAIEAVVDLVVGETRHPLAKIAKDTAAGAVLLMAIFAVIVGILIFMPYMIQLVF